MRCALPLLLALLILAPAVSQAQDSARPRDRIERVLREQMGEGPLRLVELQIKCDTDFCDDPDRQRDLANVTRLTTDAPFDPKVGAGVWERLSRAGFFRDIEVVAVVSESTVRVTYVCKRHLTVTQLRIDYATWSSRWFPKQFKAEIRKRVLLKKGGTLPPRRWSDQQYLARARLDGHPGPPTLDADLDAFITHQQTQVERLYQQQGYVGTKVTVETERHGPFGRQVRVRLVVDEGTQPPMGQLLIKGNRAFSYARIADLLTTSERIDFWKGFFSILGMGSFQRRRLREEVRLIETAYRLEGYVTARARFDGTVVRDGVVHPLIQIHEGRKVAVEFRGNRALSDGQLADVVTFKEAGAYDRTEIEGSQRAIMALYQGVARYKIAVEGAVRPQRVDEDPNTITVLFKISEGPQVYVSEVVIEGNLALTDEELLQVVETKGIAPDGVIASFGASAGVLQDAQVQGDLLRVLALYRARGFPAATLRCAPPGSDLERWNRSRAQTKADGFPGQFDLWSADPVRNRCFQILSQDDRRLVRLRFEVREGLGATVGRVDLATFVRNMSPQMQDEAIELMLRLGFGPNGKGPTGLNHKKIEMLKGLILRYYRRSGYLHAKVNPVCLGREFVEPGKPDCRADLIYGRHIQKLRFEVVPGAVTKVHGIILRGNLVTDDDVLRRELLMKDGEPLGSDQLFLTQANLRSLGIFSGVSVEPIVGDANRADVAFSTVMVTVEESRSGSFDGFGGLQIDSDITTDDLPVLYTVGASVSDKNTFGSALEVGLSGSWANRLDAPFDLEGDDSTAEGGPFYRDRRFFQTRLDLKSDIKVSQGRTAQRDRFERALKASATVGYDFYNLSYPGTWGKGIRSQFKIGYALEELRNLSRDGERPSFGDANHTRSIAPSFTVDKRDNPLHPTRGWMVSSSVALALNSTTIGLNADTSTKESLTAQAAISQLDRRLIWVPTLRVGAVQTNLKEDQLASDFLFKAGGDGVTFPIRGYEDATVDACRGQVDDGLCSGVFATDDDDQLFPLTVGGRAILSGSLEARISSFAVRDLWLAVFGDAAAIATEWKRLGKDSVFTSYGAGLRYLVTGQIPLRFDVAWPTRETAFAGQKLRFHFNIFYPL